MKIEFAGYTLGDDHNGIPISGFAVNGSRAVEVVDIVLASAKRVFSRGNALVSLSFAVQQEFAGAKEAQEWLLLLFATIPASGTCTITTGGGGESTGTVTLADAVLSAIPQGSCMGRAATVQFQILAPTATTDTPPDWSIPADEQDTMIQRNTISLTSGVDSVTVTFATAFTDPPTVAVTVLKPTDEDDNLWATLRVDSVTETGFVADLSGPTPASGYKLSYIAL